MSENTETMPTATPVQRFVDRHLLIFCTLFLVVFATLRVYFVSFFDLPTALSVLAIVNRTQLLTATVLSGAAALAPYFFIQPKFRKWLFEGNTPGAGFAKQVRTAVLLVPISYLVFVGFSIPLIVGWFLGWLLYLLLKSSARKRRRRTGLRGPGTTTGLLMSEDTSSWLLATLIGATLITVLSQPWLAKEALVVSGGEHVVGSVVGVQGAMTLVLEQPGSSARWIKTAEIESRAICRSAPRWYISSPLAFIPRPGEDCAAISTAKREASNVEG